MSKLQYHISFVENISETGNVSDEELRLIKGDLKRKIYDYLHLAGCNIEGDIELEFDMIGDDDIETWR